MLSLTVSMPVLYGLVFLFGACVGSFLNVYIYRIPLGQSIVSPPSACPVCQGRIPFFLNIPILSYLFLRGKCNKCKTVISIRYPLVELLTALFGMAVVARFQLTPEAAFWFVFIVVLIVISFIDIDHQIIPDILSIPGMFIFSLSFVMVPGMTLKQAVLGILVGGGGLYLVAVIYSLVRKTEGMGGGDIKLLAMIGAATGLKGVFFTITVSSLIGAAAGILIMLASRSTNSMLKIPFGPYLSMAAVLYVFFGEPLIQWYVHLLS